MTLSAHKHPLAAEELVTGLAFEGRLVEGLDLAGERLEEKEFDGCTFVSCNLSRTILENCRFTTCQFRGSDLSLVVLRGSSFREVHFLDSKLVGVDWAQADTTLGLQVSFDRSLLDDSSFMNLVLRGLEMADCRARGVNFAGAVLEKSTFAGTDLEDSQFTGSDLRGTDLSGAANVTIDPRESRLGGTKLSLESAMRSLDLLGIRLPDLE